jgi:hypothetical protein
MRPGAHGRWLVLLVTVVTVLSSALAALAMANPVSATTFATIEAESMSPRTVSTTVYLDAAASSGQAMFFSRNDIVSSSFESARRRLVVRARGQRCSGAPKMIVRVDGVQVLSVFVDKTYWTNYAANIKPETGQHTITISFANDRRKGPSCNRNLMVDKVSLIPELGSGTLLFADGFDRDVDDFMPAWDWIDRAYADRLTT